MTFAADGLPMATVKVGGKEHELTIDTGARYSIVGRRLKGFGERLGGLPLVGLVQGCRAGPWPSKVSTGSDARRCTTRRSS